MSANQLDKLWDALQGQRVDTFWKCTKGPQARQSPYESLCKCKADMEFCITLPRAQIDKSMWQTAMNFDFCQVNLEWWIWFGWKYRVSLKKAYLFSGIFCWFLVHIFPNIGHINKLTIKFLKNSNKRKQKYISGKKDMLFLVIFL